MTITYRRRVEELRELASMFWPTDLSNQEAELSIIPKLLETQEQFIAILSIQVVNLDGLFQIISSSTMSANIFLKHLVILADFGGEMLQRINQQFCSIFPKQTLQYIWNGQQYSYHFKALPLSTTLSNSKLGISGKKILKKQELSILHKDVIALLLFGSGSTDENVAKILSKCEISNYLGQPEKLENFIKQRYIWVSRITSGSQANTLGQIAQDFVKEYLETELNILNIQIERDSNLPSVRHTGNQDNRLTTFDLVIHKEKKYIAVEISFQVTTNSVIERKAGQAKSRFEQIEQLGYKIAYVIDGAGNFQRENAIKTLCAYSHCTVAFSRQELKVLGNFISQYFENS